MKVTTVLSFAIFAIQTLPSSAAGSACSSGIYAALAPLETYPPAVSYCKGQGGKSTVTVTVTAANARRRRAAMKTTSKSTSTKSTPTPKTSGSTSTADAKAASWSSLVQQASAVVSTFCSCAGYPATVTTTTTYTPPPPVSTCSNGEDAGQACTATAYNEGPSDDCEGDCQDISNYGQGCQSISVDSNGNCILNIVCCAQVNLSQK